MLVHIPGAQHTWALVQNPDLLSRPSLQEAGAKIIIDKEHQPLGLSTKVVTSTTQVRGVQGMYYLSARIAKNCSKDTSCERKGEVS